MAGKLAAAALATALAATGVAGPAWAGGVDLFSVARPDQIEKSSAAGPQRLGAVRDRLAAMDPAARPEAASELRIELFPGLAPTFVREASEPAYGGGVLWRGRSPEGGTASLVFARGAVTGRALFKGRVYRIEPVGGGLQRVAELDRRRLPPAGPETAAPAQARAAGDAQPDRAAAAGAADTTVTILFAYTAKAKKKSADILADINLSVALANKAYEASGVRVRMKLVGAMLAKGYDESKRSYSQVLGDVTDQTGKGKPFKPVGERRDKDGADLVSLMREGGSYCGLAWMVEAPNSDSARYGYSEVSRDCVEYDVVAHETGHNMGLNHDRYVEDKAPKSEYNFGYVNIAKRVRDIMSYSDKCSDEHVSCKQVTMFSTPDRKVDGKPFGVPKGKKGAADAARRLNETRAGVAAYRPDRPAGAARASEDAAVALGSSD